MYKCCGCGCVFEEPLYVRTTYEEMLGVDLPARTFLLLELCPNCRHDEFEEVDDYEDEED